MTIRARAERSSDTREPLSEETFDTAKFRLLLLPLDKLIFLVDCCFTSEECGGEAQNFPLRTNR